MIKPPKSNTHERIVNWIHDIFEFWIFPIDRERERKDMAAIAATTTNKKIDLDRPFQMFFNLMQFEGEIRKWDMENSFAIHMYAFLSNSRKENKVNYFECGRKKEENRKSKHILKYNSFNSRCSENVRNRENSILAFRCLSMSIRWTNMCWCYRLNIRYTGGIDSYQPIYRPPNALVLAEFIRLISQRISEHLHKEKNEEKRNKINSTYFVMLLLRTLVASLCWLSFQWWWSWRSIFFYI